MKFLDETVVFVLFFCLGFFQLDLQYVILVYFANIRYEAVELEADAKK